MLLVAEVLWLSLPVDLVDGPEWKETKSRMRNLFDGFLTELIKNIISAISKMYIRGKFPRGFSLIQPDLEFE